MQSPTALRHDNSFDALRLFFALLVILTHSYALLRMPDPLEVFSGFRYDFGKLGVTGFFAISGYLVTKSWLRNPNALRFLAARALRIFPAYWVALLFSVVAAAIFSAQADEFLSNQYTWRWLVHNAWFIWRKFSPSLPGAFEANPFPGGANGSLWTLTYELHCYAVVLILGLMTVLARRWVVWIFVAVLLGFYFKLIRDDGSLLGLAYNELYLAFATGMLIATAGYRATMALIAIACLGAALAPAFFNVAGDRWWYAPLQMTIAILVVRCANSQYLSRLSFRSGDYSYGLYVLAFPVQQAVIALLGDSASPVAVILLTVAVALPLAALSWHLVEKRALGLLDGMRFDWPFAKKVVPTGQL